MGIAMVTRTVLAKKLREPGLSYRDASIYLGILIDAIAETLSEGNSLQLRGLGSFQIAVCPEKKYPSLKTGSKVVPAHGRIVFKPCKELKQAVWNCKEEKK
jgi:integration host factor subunit beta